MTAVVSLGATLNGNQLVSFRCPGCDDIHQIRAGGANAWTWNGDLEHPTFNPSVKVTGVQRPEDSSFHKTKHTVAPGKETVCHSWVSNGQIEFLGDCTHELAGQTLDLPPWPLEA